MSIQLTGSAISAVAVAAVTAGFGGGPGNGNGGGFEIDDFGALYSGDGASSGIMPGDDWAQGDSGNGVLDDDGNAVPGFNAMRFLDMNWGNGGDGADATQFNGQSNKNDDLIGPGQAPWDWNGTGGGPQKNDITNTYLHTRLDETGDRWIFVGAETRSTNGDSHVDFEFNQAGLVLTGDIEGELIGQGPDGGRTVDDFIISIDFEQGGVSPVGSVRVWDGGAFQLLDVPGAIFAATNLTDIEHGANGSWKHFASDGTPVETLSALQLVEAAVNLTALGLAVDICSTTSTIMTKTRSSQSFTAELKDFALAPFPLEPTPECLIEGPEELCPGEGSITYTVTETTGLPDVTFVWTIEGDGLFCDGSDTAAGDTVCVDAGTGCDGDFVLSVVATRNTCEGGCNLSVAVVDDQAPEITCPDDATFECDAVKDAGEATATDNCDAAPVVDFSDATTPGDCPQEMVITRTWTATDACGNSSSCVQTITVVDTTPPMIDCPDDVTFECDDVGDSGMATATDNCDDAPEISFLDAVTQGDCAAESVTLRTWTATDACGNSSSCEQTITIVDTTGPTLSGCPADGVVQCGVPFEFTLTAEDACSDSTISCSFESSNPDAVVFEELGGGTFRITINANVSAEVTCVATDECGNDSTPCVFTLIGECPSGEGCTPGFWKQPHHFGFWTPPYTPSTKFKDVFEDAFGNMTLKKVLGLEGGHLAALGRHTVAALLNAASAEVGYDLLPGDVIDMFNGVYPGTDEEYEDLKDFFEDFNKQGCPIGGQNPGGDGEQNAPPGWFGGDDVAGTPSGHDEGDGAGERASGPAKKPRIYVNDGVLAPDGRLELRSGYVQRAGAGLRMDLGGRSSDLVVVHGDAELDGWLSVDLDGGFVSGGRLEVLRARTITGEFSRVTLADDRPVILVPEYVGGTVLVRPLGLVDLIDRLGTDDATADLDGDGRVGPLDLVGLLERWIEGRR